MDNDITAPQSASRLPTYGAEINWSFIKGREQYLVFVKDWKAAYKYLSIEIRARKLIRRSSQSNDAKPGNEKAAALIKLVPNAQFRNNWVGDTLLQIKGNRENSDTSLAWWLLEIRKLSKVKAQEFWLAENKTVTGPTAEQANDILGKPGHYHD